MQMDLVTVKLLGPRVGTGVGMVTHCLQKRAPVLLPVPLSPLLLLAMGGIKSPVVGS